MDSSVAGRFRTARPWCLRPHGSRAGRPPDCQKACSAGSDDPSPPPQPARSSWRGIAGKPGYTARLLPCRGDVMRIMAGDARQRPTCSPGSIAIRAGVSSRSPSRIARSALVCAGRQNGKETSSNSHATRPRLAGNFPPDRLSSRAKSERQAQIARPYSYEDSTQTRFKITAGGARERRRPNRTRRVASRLSQGCLRHSRIR